MGGKGENTVLVSFDIWFIRRDKKQCREPNKLDIKDTYVGFYLL